MLIPSPKVATYDLKPEMSAFEVADETVRRIRSGRYDFMVLNFAQPGHGGPYRHSQSRRQSGGSGGCVPGQGDRCLAGNGRSVLVTADHGNAECMDDDTGCAMTAHTTNPVPLIYVANDTQGITLESGGALCDIAPTLLDMMHIDKPSR